MHFFIDTAMDLYEPEARSQNARSSLAKRYDIANLDLLRMTFKHNDKKWISCYDGLETKAIDCMAHSLCVAERKSRPYYTGCDARQKLLWKKK